MYLLTRGRKSQQSNNLATKFISFGFTCTQSPGDSTRPGAESVSMIALLVLLTTIIMNTRNTISLTSELCQIFSAYVACVLGSVLLWRCRNVLYTSGFVDDVMFSCNGPDGGVTLQRRPRYNGWPVFGWVSVTIVGEWQLYRCRLPTVKCRGLRMIVCDVMLECLS